jgi:RNase adaptor protein for sRNA GlmZ degradation
MSERKEKQRTFDERRTAAASSSGEGKLPSGLVAERFSANAERDLVIYTWGAKKRRSCPHETGASFSVEHLAYREGASAHGIDLSETTGMDPELKKIVSEAARFRGSMAAIIDRVERENLTSIAINCRHGWHRSVAMANVLKDLHYPKAKVTHLELGKTY